MTITPGAEASSHSTMNLTLELCDLKKIQAPEYGNRRLEEIPYDEVRPRVYGFEHNERLKQDILTRGIVLPIVLYKKRLYGEVQVLDGYHRAVLALEHNLRLPAQLHLCFCLTSYVNGYTVCQTAREANAFLNEQAKHLGWTSENVFV